MSTTTTAETPATAAPAGGSFLIQHCKASEVLTPEGFNETHSQVRSTTDRFMAEEVLPRIGDMERKEDGLARRLIEQCGELGLLGILIPERFEGLAMDVTTQMLAAESLGKYASFSTTYGAHAGIGTLPIAFFGTEDQKRKYLPRLVRGELLAAYCLSEPQAGSDALAARTKAELSEDGKHYTLSGQKMWISNGGWADLYTVFAKVDGEKFTAFLVERGWDGVKPGAEERKMGLRGSSTTALYLDNVKVPVENVLGEVGRGHVIAFNVLNLGRLELAAACVGGVKDLMGEAATYAKNRTAFGQPIGDFGAIRQKLADMAVLAFAGEALTYRTCGMIDSRLAGLSWEDPEAPGIALKAVEEYAIECSIAKLYMSEALDYVADEAVQIHGGYGYHEDYAVERGYRDSRINRIYEGTSEINRLLAAEMLFKRAAQGRLDLMAVADPPGRRPAPDDEPPEPHSPERLRDLVRRAKRGTLAAARLAKRRFGSSLVKRQEILAALGDMITATYAAESGLLRAESLRERGESPVMEDILLVLVYRTMASLRDLGGLVLGCCCTGAELDSGFKAYDSLVGTMPVDLPAARDRIAASVLERGGFAL